MRFTRLAFVFLAGLYLAGCGGDESMSNPPGSLQSGGAAGTGNKDSGTSGASGANANEGGAGSRSENAGSGAGGTPNHGGGDSGSDVASRSDSAADVASVPLAYPSAAGKSDIMAGLAQLNRYRAAVGEAAVTLDETSSTGCEGHVNYLIAEEQTSGMANISHDEPDHSNPYYSAANEQAGMQSDIAWGGGSVPSQDQTFGEAVDLWINGLYHRHPLLDPGLKKVGAYSKNGYNCLNYRAQGNTVATKLDHPVLWPSDTMTDVPRSFTGNEGPCPTNPEDPLAGGDCGKAGFIPSATFYNWSTNKTRAIQTVSSAKLIDDAANAEVALLVYYADGQAGHDPARGYVADEIALVPQAQLASNQTYRVEISAVINGAANNLSWKFTTGTRQK